MRPKGALILLGTRGHEEREDRGKAALAKVKEGGSIQARWGSSRHRGNTFKRNIILEEGEGRLPNKK